MASPEVLCLGELVWDCYPDRRFLGGAPFNVAVQLARHGRKAALLTAVGRDEPGQRALDFLAEEGIPGARVHPRLPTGTVTVAMGAQGLPTFTIHGGCAWTDLAGADPVDGAPGPGAAPAPPAVLVFGGLAMHAGSNRRLLESLLETWGGDAPAVLCDLNLRPGWAEPEVVLWCLAHCRFLKVNQEEEAFLAPLAGLGGPDAASGFLSAWGLRGVCTTLGPEGLAWREPGKAPLALPVWSRAEGAPPVVDTVGAGDAITAAMAAGLAAGEDPERFLERGRRWAAFTCGVPGALPPRPG
ncbi:MAG: PfkB family carbohydrate kinase [Holophaga sp.]|jgi:fructokinase